MANPLENYFKSNHCCVGSLSEWGMNKSKAASGVVVKRRRPWQEYEPLTHTSDQQRRLSVRVCVCGCALPQTNKVGFLFVFVCVDVHSADCVDVHSADQIQD